MIYDFDAPAFSKRLDSSHVPLFFAFLMLEALTHSLSNIFVLIILAGFGYFAARRGVFDDSGRALISRLVNLAIPCFLFYSVTSKFTHDELADLLRMAGLPFITVALNFAVSLLMVKVGLVRREIRGAFLSCFTSSTVLFVGVPMTTALFGEAGIPYLLVYFFANCVFIWTVGLYCIQLDGVARTGGAAPVLLSRQSVRMLFSPPLLSFLTGVAVILLSVPLPDFVMSTARSFGSITSPLALFFIGMTIHKVGFAKLRRMPPELWLILLGCFVIRPLIMYLVTLPFEMEPLMRKVFVAGAALPVSSVTAVLARRYGADDEYVSEAIGVSTIGIIFALPILLLIVNFV